MKQEAFQFLGFKFNWRRSGRSGRNYPHVEPSQRSRQRLRDKVRKEWNHSTRWKTAEETVARVNQIVAGWRNYFHYGNSTRVMGRMQRWLEARLRAWLHGKYKCRGQSRYKRFQDAVLYQKYGLKRLPFNAKYKCSIACR